ncbi:MAG TPA: dienelactone hydrolase family protein [Gammaproteobacteria bacterium]|nr:dienelactone hydrolase family protein [Gammaproteobacteria bacterium]
MTDFNHHTTVDSQQMGIYAAVPQGEGPFPAVVVIQHAWGVDEFTRTMADRLAEAGFAAAAPQLYHRLAQEGNGLEMMKQLRDVEVIADVDATVDWLGGQPTVDGDRIGIIGFCMGGRVSYLMAAANPKIKASVVYYGGNIQKAWGEDVPTPFERSGEIHAPILFHFGVDDANPSPQDMALYDTELTRLGKVHEFHSYPNAGHAFMDFTNPDRHREAAARLSWPRTLGFLNRYLEQR